MQPSAPVTKYVSLIGGERSRAHRRTRGYDPGMTRFVLALSLLPLTMSAQQTPETPAPGFHDEVVTVGEQYGVRISEICSAS